MSLSVAGAISGRVFRSSQDVMRACRLPDVLLREFTKEFRLTKARHRKYADVPAAKDINYLMEDHFGIALSAAAINFGLRTMLHRDDHGQALRGGAMASD